MKRPSFLYALTFAAISLAMILKNPDAMASAPQQKTQVPGWYRIMVGSYEITALRDGYLNFQTKLIKHASAAEIAKGMEKSFLT